MRKLKKILKKSKEIVAKANKKKRLTPFQKADRESLAILAVTAPPVGAGLAAFSKEVNDQKMLERDAVQAKERQRKKLEAKKKREAANKKKENKKTKPKKMKAGGMALKGHGKAFLKGNR